MSEKKLECRSLLKTFGGVRAVNNVDLAFEIGKITALIGPNGAGKTTLFHLFTGMLKPESGDILYQSHSILGLPPWKIASLGIGRLFQDVRVFKRLSVLENILVAFNEPYMGNPWAMLSGRTKIIRQERRNRHQAIKWLELVGLTSYSLVAAEKLSYGQQKLLAIVRLLAAGADIFLLDEPTAGIHPDQIQGLLDVIRGLASEGKTVVIIEHNMNVILEIAEWGYFMDEGQVIAFGLPHKLLSDDTIKARYLGL